MSAQVTTRDLIEMHLARAQHLADIEVVRAIAAVPAKLATVIRLRAEQLEEVERDMAKIEIEVETNWGMFS